MKKRLIILLLLPVLLAGCSKTDEGTTITDGNAIEEVADDNEEWKSNVGTITLGTTITYKGEGIEVNGNVITITKGGDFTVTGTLEDGMIQIETGEKVKLRLNNTSITNSSGPAIYGIQSKKLFITLEEGTTNYLEDGQTYSVEAKGSLFSNDDLEIKGDGSLTVVGNYNHGICSDDNINIENGNITIKATTDGVHANNSIDIIGGTLNITAGSDAIDCEGEIVIDAGTMIINAKDDGIHADITLIINGGTIDIQSSYEGIESKDTLTINGGSLSVLADDDAINTGVTLVINGGDIYAECNGDGIDSNGNITINDGNVVVFSGSNANGPIDIGDGNYSYTINGGTAFISGGNMGINVSSSSSQASIWISSNLNSNSTISILDSSSTTIYSETIVKYASLVYFSSPHLTTGSTYSVSVNGTTLGSLTLNSTSSTVGNNAGNQQGFQMGGNMPQDNGKRP